MTFNERTLNRTQDVCRLGTVTRQANQRTGPFSSIYGVSFIFGGEEGVAEARGFAIARKGKESELHVTKKRGNVLTSSALTSRIDHITELSMNFEPSGNNTTLPRLSFPRSSS